MTQRSLFDDTAAGATISPDGRYRYALWRNLGGASPPLVFLMLNPSTADAQHDDPTLRACMAFGRREKASRVVVVNLFALRSTDPAVVEAAVAGHELHDPVGPENNRWIRDWTNEGRIVCAWGAFPWAVARATRVYRDLQSMGRRFYCLGLSQGGMPRHPLYVKRTTPLEPYTRLCDHKFIDSVTCLRCGWDCREEKARLEALEPPR